MISKIGAHPAFLVDFITKTWRASKGYKGTFLRYALYIWGNEWIMVTITLEQDSGFDKTHFKNLDELLAYIDVQTDVKLSHENQKFLQELDQRVDAFKKNPTQTTPLDQTISNLRKP